MHLESVLIPIVGMLIPITALLFGLIIAIAALKHRAKLNELEHQERMLAIEKGVPLPPAMIAPAKRRNPYIWGFVLIAFGLALCIGFLIARDGQFIIWGGIFFLVGLAILVANLLYKRERKEQEEGKPEGVLDDGGGNVGPGA